ncbi:UNVERIFIED_CONTAM: hypothetical protein Sradi_5688400 [Sesamum radiatum]|uniref:Uncharacterized protein n=1 Tax=Sesamum radiatum TaxID=300843 RepID=A0AAW2L3T3_SESRA
MKDNPKRLKSDKYCRFHRDRGHTTEECHNLKNEIEKLIQRGHLREYMRQHSTGGGGGSANARKALARAAKGNHGQAPMPVHNISPDKRDEISFGSLDLDPSRSQSNDALVISATLSNFWLKKVLVDSGSSADIIFYDAYIQLGIDNAQLLSVNTPLTGFSGEMIEPLGEVTLPLSLGSYPKRSTKLVKFLVVKAPSAYNIILGRPSLNLFRAIASTLHMKLKFPTPEGIGEAVGDERMARECYVNTLKRSRERLGGNTPIDKEKKRAVDPETDMRDALDDPLQKFEERRVEAVEELKIINLAVEGEGEVKMIKIGTTMSLAAEERLIEFLRENKEVFTWSMTDLQGISPDVITHHLNVNPDAKPVKQKKRMFGVERSLAIKQEVEKLLKAKYVRPVQYPEWLPNVVLVPKPNGKWRLCINFIDLNKACPKDSFPSLGFGRFHFRV